VHHARAGVTAVALAADRVPESVVIMGGGNGGAVVGFGGGRGGGGGGIAGGGRHRHLHWRWCGNRSGGSWTMAVLAVWDACAVTRCDKGMGKRVMCGK
jgi:hypothetical protein